MKKVFLSLLAAILYICSVGVSQAGVTVTGRLHTEKKANDPKYWNVFTGGTVTLISTTDPDKTYEGQISIIDDTSRFAIPNVDPGKYYIHAKPIHKDPTNLYLWRLYGEDDNIAKTQTIEVGETDFELYKYSSSGDTKARIWTYGAHATFTITGKDATPLVGLTIYHRAYTAGIAEEAKPSYSSKITDENGQISFDIYDNTQIDIHSDKTAIYRDTTASWKNNSSQLAYTIPLHERVFYTGPTSKISGTVKINNQAVTTLPDGLSLRLTPIAKEKIEGEEWEDLDCEPIITTVADGKFEFTGVPKGQRATLQVHEEAATQNGKLAYEYRITPLTDAKLLDTIQLEAIDEITHNISIDHFASAVKGSITGFPESGVYSGYVYLVAPKTAVAEGEPAFDTVQTFSFTCPNQATKVSYNFRSVLPGNYLLQIFCYQGYGLDSEIAPLTVTLEQDVTVPDIKMAPGEATVRFSPAAGSLNGLYNKYLGENVSLMEGAKLELWNKEKTERLDTVMTDIDGFAYLKTVCSLGDEFVVTISRADIYPAETTVTVTSMSLSNNFSFEGKIRFVPVAHAALEFKAVWNDATKATLTWEWPEAAKMEDLVIAKIELRRRVKTSNDWTAVKTWETPAMDALPTTFNDTEVAKGNQYTYELGVFYSTPEDVKRITCEMDARFRYKLEFSVNDEKMGSITGGQPGNYLEGTQIELTALPNPNYEFVAWTSGDDTVAKTATILFNISQDTNLVAIFKNKAFKISVLSDNSEWGTVEGEGTFEFGSEVTVTATPAKGCKFVAWKENTVEVSKEAVYKFTVEKDRTLIAVFEEEVANEDLEASRWTIFAENGTLVINGLDGDRYTVYDLNGRLAGQALCTGTEIRMTVNPNQLYIVRRVSAQGAFGFKKIVVR